MTKRQNRRRPRPHPILAARAPGRCGASAPGDGIQDASTYELSEDERADLEAALEEVARGEIASDANTAAVFARTMAAERRQGEAAVLAEAVALLDSVVDIRGPDIEEDRRRLGDFARAREAVPLSEVKAWVDSWGTAEERPRPAPRRVG